MKNHCCFLVIRQLLQGCYSIVCADLLFVSPGDLVVGTEEIDKNWWKGRKGWNIGIFPLTHVYQLEPELVDHKVLGVPELEERHDSVDQHVAQGTHCFFLLSRLVHNLKNNCAKYMFMFKIVLYIDCINLQKILSMRFMTLLLILFISLNVVLQWTSQLRWTMS